MILVTGITGHTGRYFINELVKNSYKDKIRCIIRNKEDEKYLKNTGLNYEIVIGDLGDQDFLNKVTKNVDVILEIYNIRYSLNMLEAAIKNKVNRIIFVHTTGIFSKYKMASSDYKLIESNVIKKSKKNNIDITILRPTMIFGDMCDANISKFIKMVNKFRIFPLIANGKAKIHPVNARDLGRAYYQVLMNLDKTANKSYNMSGQEEIKIKDMLKLISNYLGKKTVFIPVTMFLSVSFAYILKIFTFGKVNIVEKVLRMNETRVFSHEDASKDFDYLPEKFRDGLKREVNEFLKK